MRRAVIPASAGAAVALAVLAAAPAALACSCAVTTPEQALARADVVFSGTVVQ